MAICEGSTVFQIGQTGRLNWNVREITTSASIRYLGVILNLSESFRGESLHFIYHFGSERKFQVRLLDSSYPGAFIPLLSSKRTCARMLLVTQYVYSSHLLRNWVNDQRFGLEVPLGLPWGRLRENSIYCLSPISTCSDTTIVFWVFRFCYYVEPDQCRVILRGTLGVSFSLVHRSSGNWLQSSLGISGEKIQGIVTM